MTKRQFWSYCKEAITHRTSDEVWLTRGPRMGLGANRDYPVFLIWEHDQVHVCECKNGRDKNLWKADKRTLFDVTGIDAILLFEDMGGYSISNDMGLDFLLLASESKE